MAEGLWRVGWPQDRSFFTVALAKKELELERYMNMVERQEGGEDMIGNRPDEARTLTGTVRFRQGTSYWEPAAEHAIKTSYMQGIGRKRWGLEGGVLKNTPPFTVPMDLDCQTARQRWTQQYRQFTNVKSPQPCMQYGKEHDVPEEAVYVYCTDVLKMTSPKPTVIEKEVIVEKEVVVVRGADTLEKQAILSAALSREFAATHAEFEWAHANGRGDYAIRLGSRMSRIRELMADFGVKQMSGTPDWILEHHDIEQLEAFTDAM